MADPRIIRLVDVDAIQANRVHLTIDTPSGFAEVLAADGDAYLHAPQLSFKMPVLSIV